MTYRGDVSRIPSGQNLHTIRGLPQLECEWRHTRYSLLKNNYPSSLAMRPSLPSIWCCRMAYVLDAFLAVVVYGQH
jgi:hypothetical protein